MRGICRAVQIRSFSHLRRSLPALKTSDAREMPGSTLGSKMREFLTEPSFFAPLYPDMCMWPNSKIYVSDSVLTRKRGENRVRKSNYDSK